MMCMTETTHAHCHCHHCHAHEHAHGHESRHALLRAPGLRRIVVALMLALAAELLHAFAPDGGHVLGMALALLAVVLAGLSTYAEGLQQLRHWRLSAGALTAAAVTGAFLIGQWPEAAMVMALYALSEHLEERASARASGAMAKVLDMAPAQLEVQDEHGGWRTQPAAEVPVGALARVKPGARVALDGVVVEGASAVDEAPLTGESLPVDKKPGDSVWAGSLNLHGALTLRVTAPAGDTQLARIVRAVEQAQAERAPVQRLIDRFAAVYTPLVFALALLVAIGGTLAGWPLLDAIYRALALLVASCPCALLLATPATMMSALTLAARRGVLVKGSAHLERARLLSCLAFDKTGTLTLGTPALQEVITFDDAQRHARQWALALAARSNHPVARAIAAGLAGMEELPCEDFEELPGQGVRGVVQGVRLRLVGARTLAGQGALQAQLEQGRSVSALVREEGDEVLALFAVADTLRPGAAEAVATLRAQGVRCAVLSGDHEAAAAAVAREAGIDEVRAGLLPEGKQAALHELRASAGAVAMAGDGINDAPALAAADLGIAVAGAGADVAMEAADVVLMNGELRRIPWLIALARHAWCVLWACMALALGIKLAVITAAIAGRASMWMAVAADVGCALLVLAIGMSVLRWRGGK